MIRVCLSKILARKALRFFGAAIVAMQFFICSNVSASPVGPLTSRPIDVFALLSNTATSHFIAKSYHPLLHRLDSGIKVKGIKLADKLFLTRYKQVDGHTGLGLSLSSGDYLYQLGADQVSVSFRF